MSSTLPDHTLKDMRKTVHKAAAKLASTESTVTAPESAERKLEKYGDDPIKLTPAQARRVRKTKRRETAS